MRHTPKWLGTAFARLNSAATVGPLLVVVLTAPDWPAAQQPLVAAYQQVAIRHNHLGLAMPLDPSPRPFHDRPYLVIDAGRFTDACLAAMTDRALAALPPIGACAWAR